MLPFRLTVKQFDLTSEQKWCSCVCELTEWEACDACTPVVGSDRKSSLACVVLLFHNLLFEDLFFFFFWGFFFQQFCSTFHFVSYVTEMFLPAAILLSPGELFQWGGEGLLLFLTSLLSSGPIQFFMVPTKLKRLSHFLVIYSNVLLGDASFLCSMSIDVLEAYCLEACGRPASGSQSPCHWL